MNGTEPLLLCSNAYSVHFNCYSSQSRRIGQDLTGGYQVADWCGRATVPVLLSVLL